MKKEMQDMCVLVAGGGTAGHIEPALAVADALAHDYGAHVVALGTTRGLETDLVPARGYELALIDPVPVPRKFSMDLLKLPWRVAVAVHQTRSIMKKYGVDVLIGFGGYVSAPAYLAAASLHLPFFVHEANARAGMANKLGMRLGGRGFVAAKNSGISGELVGIPINRSFSGIRERREELVARACALWGLDHEKKTVVVTGGSQGAQSINAAVEDAVRMFVDTAGDGAVSALQILHAYGKKNSKPQGLELYPQYHAVPYIEDMPAALAMADIIVCRSGAMTVAEVTAAGVPAVYVPLPHGNGEQVLNARSIVDAGGALLVENKDLTPDLVCGLFHRLYSDPSSFERMAEITAAHSSGHAAETIAARIVDGAYT